MADAYSRRHGFETFTFLVTAATIDSVAYIARYPTKVTDVRFVCTATAASATADLKKASGTTAVASGTTVLASTIALDTTANTVTSKSLTATAADRILQPGDRLGVDVTGTLTGASTTIQITVEYI